MNIMKEAHKLTKEIKKEYPEVNYMAQLGICIAYLSKGEEIEVSERAIEIQKELNVTEEESKKLEEVEKYYQEKENGTSNLEMNLWEKGSIRRVYVKCSWRCKNQNSKGNYFDLTNNWLSDRAIGKQF